jgi:hypothetical protein
LTRLPPGNARLGFGVVRTGFSRWPTSDGQARDDDVEPQLIARDRKPIADTDIARRLDSLIIDVHMTARHRGGRLRSRLIKARKPEPFIDAQRRRITPTIT